jgi:hypothetical protein
MTAEAVLGIAVPSCCRPILAARLDAAIGLTRPLDLESCDTAAHTAKREAPWPAVGPVTGDGDEPHARRTQRLRERRELDATNASAASAARTLRSRDRRRAGYRPTVATQFSVYQTTGSRVILALDNRPYVESLAQIEVIATATCRFPLRCQWDSRLMSVDRPTRLSARGWEGLGAGRARRARCGSLGRRHSCGRVRAWCGDHRTDPGREPAGAPRG